MADDVRDLEVAPEPESRESKGERTRRQLLEIAIDHFGSAGFRATSVSEITRTAGLTQAASYAYFDNKEALFREAVDTDAAALVHEAAAQAEGVEPRQLIPSLLLFLSGGLERHPLTERVLQGLEPEAMEQLVDLPAVHEVGELVAGAIREGQTRGEVRADLDPEVVGAGVEALVLGLVMSLAHGGGATTQRHAFGVVSAFDALLRPPEG
ncbi:MAG: TetR/AcrR family transcriptional regulator [Acidimicrobiia bacterium]|nr:TetR/AcrR family transcriptional regulator [Acidimicrobiia bacterium]